MADDAAFVQAIQANPWDDQLRLVYADWLEEQGDLRADFLRVEVELMKIPPDDGPYAKILSRLSALGADLSTDWVAAISRVAIENCGVTFRFRCPKRWEKLQTTDDPAVRFCETCRRQVFFCSSIHSAVNNAWSGRCVAVDRRLVRKVGDLDALRSLEAGLEDVLTGFQFDLTVDIDEFPSTPESAPSQGRGHFSLSGLWRRMWNRRG
jgi:uncharacterized protein (TIGR02996 family)